MAPMQTPAGEFLLAKYHLSEFVKTTETVVLVEDEKTYFKSTAALKISQQLSGPFGIWYIFGTLGFLVPKFLRDAVYTMIANNRYK